MPTRRVDENLTLVIADLYTLQRRLRADSTDEEQQRLTEIASVYLVGNAHLIETAFDAWAGTPEEELKSLRGEHSELDVTAESHRFHGIASDALDTAKARRAPGAIKGLYVISDDSLHMLDRVLEYAKYVADTSELTVRWHPVEQLLDDEKALEAAVAELAPRRSDIASRRRDQVEWVPDAPATEDLLNRKPLADALAERLRRVARSRAPGSFLVHLDGAWGSGKSSILNFLRNDLEAAGKDRWLVVDFNAWQQARLGPAWWTLITALSRRMTRDLGRTKRWRLRSAELARRARSTGAPYALALVVVVVLVAAIVLLLKPAHPVASAGDTAKTITAILTAVGALWTGALFVSRLLLWKSPVGARLYERSNENPMADLSEHFGWLVSRAGRPVVFFIDDLDRCDHSYVVEFLDAVQTLVRDAPAPRVSAGRHAALGPYFVVAADGGWIRASYDAAYAKGTGALVEPGQTLGHLFLDKLFQLTVTVPSLSRTRQKIFLRQLLNSQDGDLSDLRDEKQRVEARIRDSKTQAEVRRAWEDASLVVQEAVAAAAVKRMTDEEVESETEHELEKFSPLLDLNPRRMKRFLNVYTVDLVSSGLEGNFVDPDSLALWTILRMRWPALSDFLRANPAAVDWIGDDEAFPQEVASDMRAALMHPDVAEVVRFGEGGPLSADLVKELTGRGATAH